MSHLVSIPPAPAALVQIAAAPVAAAESSSTTEPRTTGSVSILAASTQASDLAPEMPESATPDAIAMEPSITVDVTATADPLNPAPTVEPFNTPRPPDQDILPPRPIIPPERPPSTIAPPETSPPETPKPGIPTFNPNPVVPTPVAPDPIKALANEGVVELRADRQDYSRERQVFSAEGNVSMRFRGSLLVADRVQVNLLNRFVVATGKVTLTQKGQVLQGDRFEYNFVQGEGKIRGVRGEIFLSGATPTATTPLPTDISAGTNLPDQIGDRVYANQPAQNVQPGSGGINVGVGSRSNPSGSPAASGELGGTVKRLRYEADQADFTPEGLIAENVRITNDPFSPPELELRAPKVQLKRISPLQDEIKAERPKLVFDQRFTLPLLANRLMLDRRQRQPGLFQIGFDGDEKGGLFISRNFDLISTPQWRFSVTPQFLVQRAIQDGFGPNSFGVKAKLEGELGPRTKIRGVGSLNTLDLANADDKFRGNLRAQQLIGTHTLSLEASYRDRLFNNSLGFQNVQSSLGLLFYSPVIPIAKTGINLSYQVGYQRITANTDRLDLLDPIRPNDRISLNRFQTSVALNRGWLLWSGKPLPATQTAGLRYTPTPLVPYVVFSLGTTGTASLYSNGENQRNLGLTASLTGQLGHSSRDFLDYTAFNLTYTKVVLGGLSPFLFDRTADTQILFAGVTQQLYGPFRIGFQTAWNLDTGREISTDYLLEYSRRSYGVVLRYNPVQQLGSINFRISDFNWTGGTESFGGSGVRPVSGGITGVGE
jgi:hypothetical protein